MLSAEQSPVPLGALLLFAAPEGVGDRVTKARARMHTSSYIDSAARNPDRLSGGRNQRRPDLTPVGVLGLAAGKLRGKMIHSGVSGSGLHAAGTFLP
jgi:hypothetical protein